MIPIFETNMAARSSNGNFTACQTLPWLGVIGVWNLADVLVRDFSVRILHRVTRRVTEPDRELLFSAPLYSSSVEPRLIVWAAEMASNQNGRRFPAFTKQDRI